MNKIKIYKSLALVSMLAPLSSFAGEICAIKFGTDCKNSELTIMYETMKGQQDGPDGNIEICKKLPLPFYVWDLKKWKEARDNNGHLLNIENDALFGINILDPLASVKQQSLIWNGIPLNEIQYGTEVDDQGLLTWLKGKKIAHCYKKSDSGFHGWKFIKNGTGPQNVYSNCTNGMLMTESGCINPVTVGNTDPGDIVSAFSVTTAAITAGNLHDSNANESSGAAYAGSTSAEGSGTATLEGSGNADSSFGGILRSGVSSLGNMLGLGNDSSGSGSRGSAGSSSDTGNASGVANSASYGLNGSAGDGSSAGTAAQGGGNGKGFSGSSIGGSGDVGLANAQNSNQQEQYGRKLASANGQGSANGKDSDDYFTRIGLGDNLFKIVEKKYREKESGFLLGQATKKARR